MNCCDNIKKKDQLDESANNKSNVPTLCRLLVVDIEPVNFCDRDVELNPEFSSCMHQSGGVTIIMIDCITQEHERQDARLNGVYKTLMDTLPEERKSALRDAQQAWLKYREGELPFLQRSRWRDNGSCTGQRLFHDRNG